LKNQGKKIEKFFYAEKLLYCPLYSMFQRIPSCVGLLELVFRAIINRSRACPLAFWRVYPPFFLSAVFMAEWRVYPPFYGGLARRVSGGVF